MLATALIRTYKHERYISMPKSSATIQEIGDLGEVAEDDLPEADTVICDTTVIAAMKQLLFVCVWMRGQAGMFELGGQHM